MPSDTSKQPAASAPVEAPIISPTLRRKLQQCYEHGTKLMHQEKYDFDYAHSILVECAAQDPGNSIYVEAFLQNLQRKYNNNKRGALLALGGKGPFKKALAKKDWLEVLKLGPHVLKTNPWDAATLRGMADACAEFGYNEVELLYLKNALVAHPKDAEINKHCAQSLARVGQFDQAIICWQRVDETRRGDTEAQRMISELQIAKTMGRGGMVTAETARRHAAARAARGVAPTEEAHEKAPVDTARREIKLTRRQQLEQDIAQRPTDVDAYFDLAQLHIDEDRLAEAAHVLMKAQPVSGNSHKVQERIEDVEVLRKKQQLAVAERRAQSVPEEQNQQLVNQLRDDLNRLELEIYDRRAQRYPQDLELKFQLGLRLKRVGNFREALKTFELAQSLPQRKYVSALERGECLQRQKQYEKALECYCVAAEEPAADRIDIKKLALYRLGLLAEGLKHWDAAERGLSELVALDPTFKDAATRLDKLRGMRHKHA